MSARRCPTPRSWPANSASPPWWDAATPPCACTAATGSGSTAAKARSRYCPGHDGDSAGRVAAVRISCDTRSVIGQTSAVIRLIEPPRLVWPTEDVRVSYLVGEQADCLLRGTPTQWLEAASEDFAAFVAARRGVQVRWGVPSTAFWYVSGEYYLGTLVIRHQLTAELTQTGGHIGYHVVAPWRRQGHATRMLAAGLGECR